ncbi:MAG: hypothetical protein ACLVB1_14170 [Blautia obeum]
MRYYPHCVNATISENGTYIFRAGDLLKMGLVVVMQEDLWGHQNSQMSCGDFGEPYAASPGLF